MFGALLMYIFSKITLSKIPIHNYHFPVFFLSWGVHLRHSAACRGGRLCRPRLVHLYPMVAAKTLARILAKSSWAPMERKKDTICV